MQINTHIYCLKQVRPTYTLETSKEKHVHTHIYIHTHTHALCYCVAVRLSEVPSSLTKKVDYRRSTQRYYHITHHINCRLTGLELLKRSNAYSFYSWAVWRASLWVDNGHHQILEWGDVEQGGVFVVADVFVIYGMSYVWIDGESYSRCIASTGEWERNCEMTRVCMSGLGKHKSAIAFELTVQMLLPISINMF